MAIRKSDAETLIHQYSEWLDSEGLVVTEDDDERTHDDLVHEFLSTRRAFALPVVEG